MRVPRPFDPDPEEIEQPQGKESQKHIEREEKPIADENQQQSEDFHGGNESTESLPDSPNEGSEEQEEQQSDDSQQSQNNGESSADNGQQGSNGEQSQQSDGDQSSAGSSSENQNSSDKQSGENSSQGENQQTQSSNEGQQSSSNESSTSNASETSDKQSSSDGKQGESQQSSGTTEGDNSSQSSSEQSEQPSQSSDSEESVDNEQRETSDSTSQESNGETSNNTSNASEEGDTDDDADDTNGQSDETFDSEEEEQEVSNSDEESEYQVNSGTYNTVQVFDYTSAKNNLKLSRALYDFIEYVADETKVFNNLYADYYEPKKLMLRRYQGKSLNSTKLGKVRETIVVLLDNSGSMDWVREHVLDTARALIQRHDAEIYFVPNGYIETQLTKQGNEQVKHENVINKIVSQQLKVLYLGDYDGANTPIELSWKTKVFWLCPESRCRRFRSHKWVHYDESAFRGFFARTYNANEMVQALKRFAGFAQFTRYWYDPHEREVFQDD